MARAWLELGSLKVGGPCHPLSPFCLRPQETGLCGDSFDREDSFLSTFWGLRCEDRSWAAMSVWKVSWCHFLLLHKGILSVAFTKFPCSSVPFLPGQPRKLHRSREVWASQGVCTKILSLFSFHLPFVFPLSSLFFFLELGMEPRALDMLTSAPSQSYHCLSLRTFM